ncbi:hypothetical protein BHE74_00014820 [Ensete ventricosum]|nr:hypothetical protein BHE74_00014820 [Ensete ventricosum]
MIFGFRMGANERSIFCKDEPHGDEAGACEAGSTPWAFLVVDCFYCTSKCGSYHSRCGHPSQGGSCPNCPRDGGRSVVKAWSRDEPFLAEEIVNLPELSGESSHEARHSKLEIEEDKYATVLEENDMSMEVEYLLMTTILQPPKGSPKSHHQSAFFSILFLHL